MECGKEFFHNKDLIKHSVLHTGERNYKCSFPGCTKAFKSMSTQKKHIKTHENSEPSFACDEPGCGKMFRRADLLQRHKIFHAPK